MSLFFSELSKINPPKPIRYTAVYTPYDQLTDQIGPLANLKPSETIVILVETTWKGNRRNYHKQKLATILTNSRHFALEQAKKGRHVIYQIGTKSYAQELQNVVEENDIGQILVMEPAERELRQDLRSLEALGKLKTTVHHGWLSQNINYFQKTKPPWKMAQFYQRLRKQTGYLMENQAPIGGKYSFDADNRKPWKGEPPPPAPLIFEPDQITIEVVELIEKHFSEHWGQLQPDMIPATQQDAENLWSWVKKNCLVHFGTYEDAMSSLSDSLFHSKISTMLNLHRLLPKVIVEDVLKLDIPLNSKEGFIRQVLGWREFMYHVHRQTDGFRQQYLPITIDETGTVNALQAKNPLFSAYWGRRSGLYCLDTTVEQVHQTGYTHHIPRLMVLANIATLLQINPREITDWFWEAFTDAFEWVVEPNVLGMGIFATGELFTTKPYVSGGNYIHKMSDYCSQCPFNVKKNCPITRWYWHFIAQNKEHFKDNFRMKMILRSFEKRAAHQKQIDQDIFRYSVSQLQQGKQLDVQQITTIMSQK